MPNGRPISVADFGAAFKEFSNRRPHKHRRRCHCRPRRVQVSGTVQWMLQLDQTESRRCGQMRQIVARYAMFPTFLLILVGCGTRVTAPTPLPLPTRAGRRAR